MVLKAEELGNFYLVLGNISYILPLPRHVGLVALVSRIVGVTDFWVSDEVLPVKLEESQKMVSRERALSEAAIQAAGGENPVENIDHEAKVVETKRSARVEPSPLRSFERAVWVLGIGYRVEQLSLCLLAHPLPA